MINSSSQISNISPYLTNATIFGINYSLVDPSSTTTTTTTTADSSSSSSIIDDDAIEGSLNSGAAVAHHMMVPTVVLPLAFSAMSNHPSSRLLWASVGMLTLAHHACANTVAGAECGVVLNVEIVYPRHIRQICYNGTCQCTLAWSGEQCDIPNVCLLHSDGYACDDGIDCTFDDQCNNGTCVGDRRVCDNVCGDGYTAGDEECDDDNTSNNDACLNDCTLNICGDGYILNGDEQCDDGDTDNGDGCSSTCQKENGWSCSGTPSSCVTTCGDGIIAGSEQCDQGNSNVANGDGCSSACQKENGWSCTGTPSSCVTVCGDGIISGNEQCDQGNNNIANGDGCSSACQRESGWSCAGTPSSCVTTCGDGIIAGNEQCDQGNNNIADNDGCSSTCQKENGWSCSGTPSSCVTVCGDGVIAGDEQCDDGATDNGDGCSSTCQRENGWNCAGTPSSCITVCGDGIIAGSEQCDQGSNNIANGDGCSSACQKESGWSCTGTPSSCVTTCGDGIIAGNEQCDQGSNNIANGDGCSSTCQRESGWSCTGTPSSCVFDPHFAASTLLNSTMKEQLLAWFPPAGGSTWTSCFRTDVDGCGAAAFHANCNNKGATITVASANGYLFGGYTDFAWIGSNYYHMDSTASAIISFTRPSGGAFKKLTRGGAGPQYSTYDGTNYGPTFGGGHDLYLASNCCSNTDSYTYLGYSYVNSDVTAPTTAAQTYLCGSYHFTIAKYEVFYLSSS